MQISRQNLHTNFSQAQCLLSGHFPYTMTKNNYTLTTIEKSYKTETIPFELKM